MDTSRRDFICRTVIATTGFALGYNPAEAAFAAPTTAFAPSHLAPTKTQVCIFSKHLHFLDYPQLADTAAKIGFDGIDLSVRANGHVLPENVKTDLAKAVAIIKKAGLSVPTITTNITDAAHPHTEDILKTASQLGIKYYRMGSLKYKPEISIPENLQNYQRQFKALAELNKKYGLHGAYQNHAGTDVGAPVWDLWTLLKDLDPTYAGVQYDIKHATMEGGNAWPLGLKLLEPYIKTMDIKDFIWAKKDGKWHYEYVPLGEGMVDYKKYFALLKEYKKQGVMSLHLEYPLGGAEKGSKTLTIPAEKVYAAVKQDLQTLRTWLKEADL